MHMHQHCQHIRGFAFMRYINPQLTLTYAMPLVACSGLEKGILYTLWSARSVI